MPDWSKLQPVEDATLGWGFAYSRVGASHTRSNKPCQDACALWPNSVSEAGLLIAAVADGHGDEAHDRSQFGARLAVLAAIEELVGLQKRFGQEHESLLIDSFRGDFPRLVGRRWRKAVRADDRSRRSPEELCKALDSSVLASRYGTTLIVAMVVRNKLLLGQIGDGVAMLVKPDGSVESPLKNRTADVGVVTDSLCSHDAHNLWRTAALDSSQGGLVLLCTDGLENSFSDDIQMEKFAESIHGFIRELGLEKVASSVPEWLDQYSKSGSGDDITLAGVILPQIGEARAVEESTSDATGSDTAADEMISPSSVGEAEEQLVTDATSINKSDQSQGGADVIGDGATSPRGDGQDSSGGERETG